MQRRPQSNSARMARLLLGSYVRWPHTLSVQLSDHVIKDQWYD